MGPDLNGLGENAGFEEVSKLDAAASETAEAAVPSQGLNPGGGVAAKAVEPGNAEEPTPDATENKAHSRGPIELFVRTGCEDEGVDYGRAL